MPVPTTRLSPAAGAEIRNISLTNLDDAGFAELYRAWNDADGVLVVRGQSLAEPDHVAFSRKFGPIYDDPDTEPMSHTVSKYLHPDWPQIYRVSNITDSNGEPLGRRKAGTYWHSDCSYLAKGAKASILHALEIPPYGGDTMFANLGAAYDALSEPMKDLLADLHAVHDFQVASKGWTHETKADDDLTSRTRNRHPIVRTHADTGRKSLFVNPGFTSHIDGFTEAESSALLGFLYDHCQQAEFIYRHRWEPGDVVIWDNRNTMHCAVSDYPDGHRRYMHRTTGIGEQPV
ncbi:MAG: TauD/TfdA family dioxygenase [Pseudomonadota bacterium]